MLIKIKMHQTRSETESSQVKLYITHHMYWNETYSQNEKNNRMNHIHIIKTANEQIKFKLSKIALIPLLGNQETDF
jgi:hypothetical protein